jgi:hypothetical protein
VTLLLRFLWACVRVWDRLRAAVTGDYVSSSWVSLHERAEWKAGIDGVPWPWPVRKDR